MSKIKNIEELKKIVGNLKKEGKTIVTCNGSFDIFHHAHASLLSEMKKLGDILIVLLNSDSSIQKNKGPNRPIIPEDQRAFLLAALESVDYVTIFNEQKPLNYLSKIKPHIHAKGVRGIPELCKEEKELVESFGGKLEIVDSIVRNSTSSIIKKILELHLNDPEFKDINTKEREILKHTKNEKIKSG